MIKIGLEEILNLDYYNRNRPHVLVRDRTHKHPDDFLGNLGGQVFF